ncbi:hypothetical protein [Kineococcus sp. SYSU DK005]|uniref:hypothetical protein n=1 Tax=Kineococcus sp. SYSU DK005 TaxID=3383126 RepID=UPI003D7E5100
MSTPAAQAAATYHAGVSGTLATAALGGMGLHYGSIHLEGSTTASGSGTLYAYGNFPDTCVPADDGGRICGWHYISLQAEVPTAHGGIRPDLSSAGAHLRQVPFSESISGQAYDRQGNALGYTYLTRTRLTDVDVTFSATARAQRSAQHSTTCLGGEFTCQSVQVNAIAPASAHVQLAGHTLTDADFDSLAPRIASWRGIETGKIGDQPR